MKAYLDIINEILNTGTNRTDRTGTGTIAKFGLQFRHNLQDGFPLLTTKKLHLKSIVGELLWFIGCHMKHEEYTKLPKTNTKYLEDNGISIWREWQDEDGNLGNVYGKQWTNWVNNNGIEINQLDDVINTLINNPDSRRIILMAWNVGELDTMALPPCHMMFQCDSQEMSDDERIFEFEKHINKIGGNFDEMTLNEIQIKMSEMNFPTRKLNLKWTQRSVDTFLGLPYNIASYALLTHILAAHSNHIPNELIGDLGNTHIYKNHMKYVMEQLTRDVQILPEIQFIKKDSIYDYEINDFSVLNYNAAPNWKNVPIAV